MNTLKELFGERLQTEGDSFEKSIHHIQIKSQKLFEETQGND